jgi:hypothetical protein
MTRKAEGAGTRAVDIAGQSPIALDHQGDAKGQGGQADEGKVEGKGEGKS